MECPKNVINCHAVPKYAYNFSFMVINFYGQKYVNISLQFIPEFSLFIKPWAPTFSVWYRRQSIQL